MSLTPEEIRQRLQAAGYQVEPFNEGRYLHVFALATAFEPLARALPQPEDEDQAFLRLLAQFGDGRYEQCFIRAACNPERVETALRRGWVRIVHVPPGLEAVLLTPAGRAAVSSGVGK